MKLQIKKITQKDNAYHIITEWFKEWWQEEEGYSFDETEAIMSHSLNSTRFPCTYAMFADDKVVGAFQFTLFDLHVRPDIYPWLANVYVAKEERGKGYSRFLLESAVRLAKEEGIQKLWLFTSHVGLYERYGFELECEVDVFTKTPRIQRIYSMEFSRVDK